MAEITAQAAGGDAAAKPIEQWEDDVQCKYACEVESWVRKVVVGLGLCPWAISSTRKGCVQYVTCEGDRPGDVMRVLLREADRLRGSDVAPLSTTLIICPHVAAWKSFSVFHAWHTQSELLLRASRDTRHVSLVHFHPEFMLWRAFEEGNGVGSEVQSHYILGDGSATLRRSAEIVPAAIVQIEPPEVGARVLTVELPNGVMQNVPFEFCVSNIGPPLLDNGMHRAPYPTIQLIRDADLDEDDGNIPRITAVNLRNRNARRMRQLGWDGLRETMR